MQLVITDTGQALINTHIHPCFQLMLSLSLPPLSSKCFGVSHYYLLFLFLVIPSSSFLPASPSSPLKRISTYCIGAAYT